MQIPFSLTRAELSRVEKSRDRRQVFIPDSSWTSKVTHNPSSLVASAIHDDTSAGPPRLPVAGAAFLTLPEGVSGPVP